MYLQYRRAGKVLCLGVLSTWWEQTDHSEQFLFSVSHLSLPSSTIQITACVVSDQFSLSCCRYDFRIGWQNKLLIPYLRFNHTGEYQCHSNPTATCNVFSGSASLTVRSKPYSHSLDWKKNIYNRSTTTATRKTAEPPPLPLFFSSSV